MKELIAVVGMCGAGKSEITEYFIRHGFYHLHFGDLTQKELKKNGLPVNEKNEREARERLRKEYGKAAFAVLSIDEIKEHENENVVIDGLYSWSEYRYLKERYPEMKVIAVVTDNAVRKERLSVRPVRPLTNEEVDSRDVAEIENLEKGGPIAIADYYVVNNGDLSETLARLEKLPIRLS